MVLPSGQYPWAIKDFYFSFLSDQHRPLSMHLNTWRGLSFSTSSLKQTIRVLGRALLQWQSLLKQLELLLHKMPVALFQLRHNRPHILCVPDSRITRTFFKSPRVPLARDSGKIMLPGCSVQHIFHTLSCPNWAYCSQGNSCLICYKSCCCSGPHLKCFFFWVIC